MTESTSPTTRFAPAERAAPAELASQVELLARHGERFAVLDAVPQVILILNRQRQIVFLNHSALGLFGGRPRQLLIGQRTGEALRCIRATLEPGGCGTSEFCATCGAAKAILECHAGVESVQECRITQDVDLDALELRVKAVPIDVAGEPMTLFAVENIADEKRRECLERAFFHDVLNTSGGILGCLELLSMDGGEPAEEQDLRQTVLQLSRQLVEEIQSQRLLMQAERGSIALEPVPLDARTCAEEAVRSYTHHPAAEGRSLRLFECGANRAFQSDRTLLQRILGNMVKNALEACPLGGEVGVGWRDGHGGELEFGVHNPGCIPREVQLQLFQRSFTTKGAGRGIGTYSMKLLGERYLGGEVGFDSTELDGTSFWIRLPVRARFAA